MIQTHTVRAESLTNSDVIVGQPIITRDGDEEALTWPIHAVRVNGDKTTVETTTGQRLTYRRAEPIRVLTEATV